MSSRTFKYASVSRREKPYENARHEILPLSTIFKDSALIQRIPISKNQQDFAVGWKYYVKKCKCNMAPCQSECEEYRIERACIHDVGGK